VAVLLMGWSCARESTLEPTWLGASSFPNFSTFTLYSNEGIYPDKTVLIDEDNPFRHMGVSEEMKWQISLDETPIAAFYAWATVLANAPSGEAQFYTGLALENISYFTNRVLAKQRAIKAFQAVLDYFPNSVTYAANGIDYYGLGVLAYNKIIELGGTPRGYTVYSNKLIKGY
jgi:hypothetical protein